MFKVLCISEPLICIGNSIPIVKVGLIYEVINVLEKNEDVYYEISEHPEKGYHSRLFVPISDIDETEMKRDYSRVDKSIFIKH